MAHLGRIAAMEGPILGKRIALFVLLRLSAWGTYYWCGFILGDVW